LRQGTDFRTERTSAFVGKAAKGTRSDGRTPPLASAGRKKAFDANTGALFLNRDWKTVGAWGKGVGRLHRGEGWNLRAFASGYQFRDWMHLCFCV
jgi:hypothetical protein